MKLIQFIVQVRGSGPCNFSQMMGEMLEIQHSVTVVCEFLKSYHQLSVFVKKDQSKKYLSDELLHLARVYLMKTICILYANGSPKLPVVLHYKTNKPY